MAKSRVERWPIVLERCRDPPFGTSQLLLALSAAEAFEMTIGRQGHGAQIPWFTRDETGHPKYRFAGTSGREHR